MLALRVCWVMNSSSAAWEKLRLRATCRKYWMV